jgi:two-component system sensor histidine kinase/response regulator
VAKILVIEDDEQVCEMIAEALQTEGYETIQARDGRTGLEAAQKQAPDLVLCDVTMPGMDGYATLRALREDPSTAMTPFIFLTGHSEKAGMRQAMELGADDYLAKPVMIPDLVAAIESRLRKYELVRAETARKLNELRTSLSLALPHEIRTPLSGIIGFAEVLRDDSARLKPDEISQMASLILKSATRLGHLVENSLTHAQLELLSSSPAEKAFVGKESTTMLRDHIEEIAARISTEAERPGDVRMSIVEADAALSVKSMNRIIEELLDNAFKYSKPGTPVEITSTMDNGFYCLIIRDHGVGMDKTHLREIGAYRQFNRELQEQQGYGLGLAITRRITELYGGTFSIESEVGKGTTVTIRLPLPAGI